jgi:hypothetical protein
MLTWPELRQHFESRPAGFKKAVFRLELNLENTSPELNRAKLQPT